MPTQPHIYQVRDIVEMLLKHPQDADCVATIGETKEYIADIKYRCNRRREVVINTEGEDRIKTLESDLVEMEESFNRSRHLLEKFHGLMDGPLGGDDLIEALQELQKEVTKFL